MWYAAQQAHAELVNQVRLLRQQAHHATPFTGHISEIVRPTESTEPLWLTAHMTSEELSFFTHVRDTVATLAATAESMLVLHAPEARASAEPLRCHSCGLPWPCSTLDAARKGLGHS